MHDSLEGRGFQGKWMKNQYRGFFIPIKLLVLTVYIPDCASPLPIAYCPLPIAHCLLPIAHCPLPIAHCPLPIAYCPLPIAHSLFP
ncbi:hypothetical protein [Coleofasciculus chthonoplastes]|nr:hypothetical protein [Coleofasciculus chthonoplastes]